MGLYKRKNSNIWQMCFFVNGQKVRMSTKTSNKKVAQRIYEKARVDSIEGKQMSGGRGKMPFDRLVDEFIEKHSKVEKASFKHDISRGGTLKRYFKQTPIEKITAYDVKSWRQWRKEHVTKRGTLITKATLNKELSLLKTMFTMAVEWGWLKESPCVTIKKLKGETQRLRYLNREEIARLVECAHESIKPVIIMAASTGMRRGEILSLKWKNIDFDNGFIRVEKSKNHDSRDIPMDKFLLETLWSLRKSREIGNYVFCKENGDMYKRIEYNFRSACRRARLEDFRFHDLRHTAASILACGGCDLITLKNLLGHRSILMTQRYAHFMPEQHEKTRRVMGSIWTKQSDTFENTPVFFEGSGSVEKPYQQIVSGHATN